MKLQNLSVRAFLRKIVAGTLLTAALLLLIFFLLTKDVRVVICGIILTAAFYIWGMVFLHYTSGVLDRRHPVVYVSCGTNHIKILMQAAVRSHH